MEVKKLIKRYVASALVTIMALTDSVYAFAEGNQTNSVDNSALASELYVSSEYAEEHSNGVFAFYQGKVVANEGDGTAEIKVVRKGGTKGTAKVVFKAVDLTAVYGTDYTIKVKESIFSKVLEPNSEASPLINRYMNEGNYEAIPGDKVASEEAAIIEQIIQENSEETTVEETTVYDVSTTEEQTTEETTVTEEISEAASETGSEETYSSDTSYENSGEYSQYTAKPTGRKNALMNGAAAYSGVSAEKKNWKDSLGDEVSQEDNQAISEEIRNKAMEEEYNLEGVDYVLTFEDGEIAKTLTVQINDDEVYKNESLFFTFLLSCEGSEIDSVNTGYVNIQDNDAVEKSVYSVAQTYQYVGSDKDEVEIKVTRSGGINFLDTVNIYTKDGTGKAGQDYTANSTQLLFPGGVTERTFRVKLNKNRKAGNDFFAILDGESGNVSKNSATAKVVFQQENTTALSTNGIVDLKDSPNKVDYYNNCGNVSVNSKDRYESSQYNINTDMVDHIEVDYACNSGTKVCKKMHYDGYANITVGNDTRTIRVSGQGSGTVSFSTGGHLDNVGFGAKTEGKNSYYAINITQIRVYHKSATLVINNNAGTNNTYKPKVWSAVNGAKLYTEGRTTYYADKSQTIDNIERYYNYKDISHFSDDNYFKIANLSTNAGENIQIGYNETVSLRSAFHGDWSNDSAYLDSINIVGPKGTKSMAATDTITFNSDFFNNYNGYYSVDGNNVIINMVPVYKPRTATVKINNTAQGGVSGTYDNKDTFNITRNDSIAVQCLGNNGYFANNVYIEGGENNDKNDNKDIISIKDKASVPENGYSFEINTTTDALFPVKYPYIEVSPAYGNTSLKFKLDPGANAHADKGSVMYSKNSDEIYVSENNLLTIENAKMGENYTVTGAVNRERSGSVKFQDSSVSAENLKIKLINSQGYDIDNADLKKDIENGVLTDANGNFDFDNFYVLDPAKNYQFTVRFEYNGVNYDKVVDVKNSKLVQSTIFTVGSDGTVNISGKDIDYSDYNFHWRDGTFADENGNRSVEQTTKAKEFDIDIDKRYVGNSFSYIFNNYYESQVFYSLFTKDEEQYNRPGKLSGYVYTVERELFSGNSRSVPAVGASVYTVNQNLFTDNNGYFEYSFDKGYNVSDIMTLVILYNGVNYGDTIAVGQEKSYTIDEGDKIKISNPVLLKNKEKIDYASSDFDNGSSNYTIRVQVDGSGLILPQKVYLTAYNSSGTVIGTNTSAITSGFAEFNFNPTAFKADGSTESIKLGEGTTFTVRAEDQNQKQYSEVKTGLSLSEHCEEKGFKASVEPDGGSANLIGSFASGIGANSVGTDEDKSQVYQLSDLDAQYVYEDETTAELTTISDKNSVADMYASDPSDTSAYTGNALKYQVLNLGISLSGEGNSRGETTESVTGGSFIPRALKDAIKKSDVKKGFDRLVQDLNTAKQVRTDYKNGQANENAGFAKEASFSFDVVVSARIAWMKNGNENWVFSDAYIIESAKADFSAEFTYQTPFIIQILGDVSFNIGVSGTQLYVKKQSKSSDKPSIKMGVVNLGNIAKNHDVFAGEDDYIYKDVDFDIGLGLYAGVGFKMLNAKIGGDANYHYAYKTYEEEDINYKDTDTENYLTLTAKVKLKALVFNVSYEFAHKRYDFVNNNKAANSIVSMKDSLNMGGGDILLNKANNTFEAEDLSYLDGREGWTGSSKLVRDMNMNLGLSTVENQIVDRVYEDAVPMLENIGNGQYLMVYCDRISGSTEKTGVYYSVYDGVWSNPKLLSTSEGAAESPYVFNMENKVAVSWAESKALNTGDISGTLNSMDIKLSVFDKNTMSFGEALSVTHDTETDKYSDNYPIISRGVRNGRDTLIVYYFKSYYEENNALVGDIINPYTVPVCRLYDIESGKFTDEYTQEEQAQIEANTLYSEQIDVEGYADMWYGQKFLNLSPKVYVDESAVLNSDGTWDTTPNVVSNTSQTYSNILDADGAQYNGKSVLTYVLDEDDNLGTSDDRQIYIQIYDIENNTFSDAMKVTNSNTECASPAMITLGEKLYLLWRDKEGVKCIDLGNIVDNCIKEITADGKPANIIDKLTDGTYTPPMLLIPAEDNSGISNFSLSSDGDDTAYICWSKPETKLKDGVDPDSEEAQKPENKIVERPVYVARYNDKDNELSIPVKMAEDEGASYGQLAFDVTDGNTVKAVATKGQSDLIQVKSEGLTAQYTGENSQKRSLVELNFNVKDDVNINNAQIENVIYGNKPSAEVSFKNEGFVNNNGVKLEAYIGDTLVGQSESLDINSGEEKSVSIELPEITEMGELTVTLKLINSDGIVVDTRNVTSEVKSDIAIDITDTYFIDRDTVGIDYTIKNSGNYPEKDVLIDVIPNGGTTPIKEVNTGDLLPGQNNSDTLEFKVTPDMFKEVESDSGYKECIELLIRTNTASAKTSLTRSVTASQIEKFGNTSKITSDFTDVVSIKQGEKVDLNLGVNSEDDNGIRYEIRSSDESISKGNHLGVLWGLKTGTCSVTAYAVPFNDSIVFTGADKRYTEDNFTDIPEKYVVKKTFTVVVTGDEEPSTEVTTVRRAIGSGDDSVDTGVYGNSTNKETTTKAVSEATTENVSETTENNTEQTTENNINKAKTPFEDIVGMWCEDTISDLYTKGIVSGVSKTEFAPNRNVKRGDFVMLIMNTIGDRAEGETNYKEFEDVKSDSYYYSSIMKARKLGIALGFDNNTFKPDEPVTREEMCAFTARTMRMFNILDESNKEIEFKDKDSISAYALKDIADLTQAGIIQGYEDNEIKPKEYTKRSEAAQLVFNILNQL